MHHRLHCVVFAMLIFANIGGVMMAQDIHGVTLAGTLTSPIIVNNSGHTVVAYTLQITIQKSGRPFPWLYARDAYLNMRNDAFLAAIHQPTNPAPNGMPPGQTQAVQFSDKEKSQGISNITLDAVVFDNGMLSGPDTGGYFDNLTAQLSGERDLHKSVLSAIASGQDPWATVQTLANQDTRSFQITTNSDWVYQMRRHMAASELIRIKQTGGVTNAIEFAKATVAVYPNIQKEQ
jgi:hypothetical protein